VSTVNPLKIKYDFSMHGVVLQNRLVAAPPAVVTQFEIPGA
jgi:hypothetical protein